MTMPERLIDDVVRQAGVSILDTGREMDEWDQAPFITLVARRGDKPVCVPVSVPDYLWADVHPAQVLKGLTYGVKTGKLKFVLGNPITTADICGVILFTEGHGIDDSDLTEAERITLDDFRENHRIEEHPKCRELRMAHMIDRGLTSAMARHFRGVETVSDQIIYNMSGRIPESLERFVTALLASWIAEEAQTN